MTRKHPHNGTRSKKKPGAKPQSPRGSRTRLPTDPIKSAEKKLRREHELNEAIINTTQQIVLLLDTHGRIVRFNKYLEDLTGWPLAEVKGKDWFDIFLPVQERGQIRDVYDQALSGKRTRAKVNPIVTRDGRLRDIEWYDAPLNDAGGKPIGLLCTGMDITDQRELQKQVLETAAEEDRRIGQELHDGVQQVLTGLELFAASMLRDLDKLERREFEGATCRTIGEAGFQTIRGRIIKIRDGLEEVHHLIQVLSRGIMPVQVDALGLNAALRELASATDAQTDFQCSYWSPEVIEVADNTTATHLYRIAQEAINNAMRHSRGDEIRISLLNEREKLVLEISDNGIGFNVTEDGAGGVSGKYQGIGLRAMHYRASLIGATLQIESGEGDGSNIRCIVSPG